MRVRVFLDRMRDHGGIADYETSHVPAIGDLLTLRLSSNIETAYRVSGRIFRADPDGSPKTEQTYFVGLKVSEVGKENEFLVDLV